MSDFNSESFPENEWDECGDLAWNEFDWERYLREQDDILHRYLAFYEGLKARPDRIDEVASLMGWDTGQLGGDSSDATGSSAKEEPADPPASDRISPLEPYTLHKNPVFVATKAIYLSLKRSWERLAADPAKITQSLALATQTSLYRGEEHAILGVQAIDLGDYALAISLFKRALQEINQTLAFASDSATAIQAVAAWRDDALPRLFDLREIWLRVISECRNELERRVDEEG
jgi:tetratricopeptide (TPR) repeat protein